MKQLQFYKWALIFLLALNLILIAFLIIGHPKPHDNKLRKRRQLMEIGIEEMQLNNKQIERFRSFALKHDQDIKPIIKHQKNALHDYFKTLTLEEKGISDSLFILLKDIEGQKIQLTYSHFKEIKGLLEPEQIPAFKDFVQGAVGNFFAKRKNNKKQAKDLAE